jgi:hypothetical protein
MAHRLVALCALLAVGCVDYLDPGELGEPRYFGEVLGVAPLRLIPPVSDRDGNVYVLYGARDLNQAEAFVGHVGGGWSAGCDLHEGDARGAHGWVGRAKSRAWYWSGDALVEVSGATGNCTSVLDRDPSSGANLQFLGVVPFVTESPSRVTVPALVQSAADRLPFFVLVDLDLERTSAVTRFEPNDASNVVVLGVGADPDSGTGVMVVSYERGGGRTVEAIYLDSEGQIVARSTLSGLDAEPVDGVLGFLMSIDGRSFLGLLDTGDLIAFDRGGGGARPAGTSFSPLGVHRWDDRLFVVGISGADPAVARVGSDGSVGDGLLFTAARNAQQALSGSLVVLDDRSDPRQHHTWTSPASAIGPQPFLSPFSPDVYALDTTGWLIAGPSFGGGGGEQTSVAFAPMGISYP